MVCNLSQWYVAHYGDHLSGQLHTTEIISTECCTRRRWSPWYVAHRWDDLCSMLHITETSLWSNISTKSKLNSKILFIRSPDKTGGPKSRDTLPLKELELFKFAWFYPFAFIIAIILPVRQKSYNTKFKYSFSFFLHPLGILLHFFQCRHCNRKPTPGHMRYVYNFIAVCSECWTVGRFRPTRPPKVVRKVCLLTSSESGLSPLDIVCTP